MKIKEFLVDSYSGLSLGGLMGLIIGLSASPVVQIVIGTVAGLLGAFFSLKLKTPESTAEKGDRKYIRIGSFGVSAILFLILGISIRTNNLISPTPTSRMERWIETGYDSTSARAIVLYELLGLRIDSNNAIEVLSEKDPTLSDILLSNKTPTKDQSLCDKINPKNFNRFQILRFYRLSGRKDLEDCALHLERMNSPKQDSLIALTFKSLCNSN